MKHEKAFENLIQVVSNATGLSKAGILKNTRERKRVNARKILVYLLRERYNMGWTRMGELMGLHHSTLIHNYNYVISSYRFDLEIKEIKDKVDVVTKEQEDVMKKSLLNILEDKYTSMEGKLDILVDILRNEEGNISYYDKLRVESYSLREGDKEASKGLEKISIHDLYDGKNS
jgi:hypothetical protein